MNDFFQLMWRSDNYVNPGPYFRTLEAGVEFLKEDVKKRTGVVYNPFLGELETRSFNQTVEPEIVARQVRIGRHRLSVKVEEEFRQCEAMHWYAENHGVACNLAWGHELEGIDKHDFS